MSSSSEILGPYDVGGVKRPRAEADRSNLPSEIHEIVEEQSKKKEKKEKKDKKEKKGSKDKEKKTKSSKSAENDDNDEINEEEELTLAERLARISNQIDDLENDKLPSEEEAPEEHKKKKSRQSTTELSIPTADSLVTLLEQAIQSNDTYLLEQCLACSNLEIIDATIRKLPTQRILIFLRTLVAKFERRPSRGILITHWISSILKHHLSYLITIPDLSSQLAGLSQILEQRISSYTKLTSLAGRLDLLMSQVVKQQTVNSIEPQVIYEF